MNIHKDEQGYIVVETLGTFIPFVLLMLSIISLINIVTVQARVHYALTQTANTLSTYCYVLEVLGVANSLTELENKAYKTAKDVNEIRGNVNDVLYGIDSLEGMLGGVDSMGNVYNKAADLSADPEALLQNLMCYGVQELMSAALEELARPLVGRYLANMYMTGDEYLKSVHVIDSKTGKSGLETLEFYQFGNFGVGNSALLDRDGNVRLTVEYDIEYTFGILPLPFKPKLHITQTVVTKAWLNGSGRGYWKVDEN